MPSLWFDFESETKKMIYWISLITFLLFSNIVDARSAQRSPFQFPQNDKLENCFGETMSIATGSLVLHSPTRGGDIFRRGSGGTILGVNSIEIDFYLFVAYLFDFCDVFKKRFKTMGISLVFC